MVVSEEKEGVTVLFATEAGLAEFAIPLTQMADGKVPTRIDILYAIQRIENVTPMDRTGPALLSEGAPGAIPEGSDA